MSDKRQLRLLTVKWYRLNRYRRQGQRVRKQSGGIFSTSVDGVAYFGSLPSLEKIIEESL